RELLARPLILARFDRDAFGGTRRRAHVAGNAARRAVLARGENVASPEALRIDSLHFRIRDDRQLAEVEQIVDQMLDRDEHPCDDLRNVRALGKRELARLDPYDSRL